ATGQRPRGFRAAGFSVSSQALQILAQRGYQYDASSLPTFLGPLARAYYSLRTGLDAADLQRVALFGSMRDALRPIEPHLIRVGDRDLLEIPVTTMPLLRLPIHATYAIYLSTLSPALALGYFRTALRLCRATGTAPSILFHPLDFLGREDVPALSY